MNRAANPLLMAGIALLLFPLACARQSPAPVLEKPPAEATKPGASPKPAPKPPPKKDDKGLIVEAHIDAPREGDSFARSQVDLGMTAFVEGSKLRVTIENRSKKDLIVGPKNFGLIPHESKDVLTFRDPEAGFPPVRLHPGDQRVGVLTLLKNSDRALGGRLVFNHPDCRTALALVKASPIKQLPAETEHNPDILESPKGMSN